MNDVVVYSGGHSPLTSTDQVLIGELCHLTRKLDRYGALAEIASEGTLLPADILEQPADVRIAHLTAAVSRCRHRVGEVRGARRRRRLLSIMVPFAIGLAGTPYVLHLLT